MLSHPSPQPSPHLRSAQDFTKGPEGSLIPATLQPGWVCEEWGGGPLERASGLEEPRSLDQSSDRTGRCTGAQPVSLPLFQPCSLTTAVHAAVSLQGGKGLLLPWSRTGFALRAVTGLQKELPDWTPRRAVVKGGRWPPSEHKGVLGTRGGGTAQGSGGGILFPCSFTGSCVAGLQHHTWRTSPPSATQVADICKGGFLGVTGSRTVALAQAADPKQSFTYVQKLPSALWVEPRPGLHSLRPSLEAQRCPQAAPSHTCSQSPWGPGRGWTNPCHPGCGA